MSELVQVVAFLDKLQLQQLSLEARQEVLTFNNISYNTAGEGKLEMEMSFLVSLVSVSCEKQFWENSIDSDSFNFCLHHNLG